MNLSTLKNLVPLVAAVTLGALLAACATTQEHHPRLDRAQAEVQKAEANPAVNQYAAAALARAEDALSKAKAGVKNDNPTLTKHFSYLAERRAQTAVAKAREADANQAAKQARDERAQALKNQATQARQQSREARQEAQSAREQAAEERAKNRKSQSELESLKKKLANLHPKKTKQGIVLTLGDVLFGFDKSDLKPSAKPTLDKLAQFLDAHKKVKVVINGYTDSVGSKAYNKKLSEARAESVASALEQRGITSARLTTNGNGESNPVASNSTAEGRTKNRRVEFILKNVGG